MTLAALTVGAALAAADPAHRVAAEARRLQAVETDMLLAARTALALRRVISASQQITLQALDRLLIGRGWVLPIPRHRLAATH